MTTRGVSKLNEVKIDIKIETETENNEKKIKRKKLHLSSWAKSVDEPSEKELKLMVAIMLSKAVRKLLENQCYQLNEKIYQLIKKGSIGYDLQRCVCNIVMEEHGIEVLDLLKDININTDPELEINFQTELYFTYVDDNWTKMKSVPDGSTYDKIEK